MSLMISNLSLAIVLSVPAPTSSDPAPNHGTPMMRRPTVARPLRRGTGLLIAGAVLTGSLFVGRTVLSGLMIDEAFQTDGPGPGVLKFDGFFRSAYLTADLMTPGLLVSLGLLGGGLWHRGEHGAREDLFLRRSPRHDMRLRARLGWGLLASGLAVWALWPRAGRFCRTPGCFLGVHEGGFYLGAALLGAGVGLAPFATAYVLETGARARQTVRVLPRFGRSEASISISGRF